MESQTPRLVLPSEWYIMAGAGLVGVELQWLVGHMTKVATREQTSLGAFAMQGACRVEVSDLRCK